MKRIMIALIFLMLCSAGNAQNSLNQIITEEKLHYIALKSELTKTVHLYNSSLTSLQQDYNMPVVSISADTLIEALRPEFPLQSPYSKNALELHADRLMMRNRGIEYFTSHIAAQQTNLVNLWNIAQACDTKLMALETEFLEVQDSMLALKQEQESRKNRGLSRFVITFVSGLVVGGLIGGVAF
ncbi:hypothetical protein GF337_03265 [candidate division KSB1 bacterium]|nr:hypothetical protein [candidate division KSB1 bacterium]